MLSLSIRRIVPGAAALALAISLFTAPVTTQAAGLAADPSPGMRDFPIVLLRPDVAVLTHGTQVNNGTTYFLFTLKNIGQATARDLKVSKKLVYRHKLNNAFAGEKTAVVMVGEIPVGVEIPMTKMCDAPASQYCDFATVTVEVNGTVTDKDLSNNFGKIES
jgi:hypothetical protein